MYQALHEVNSLKAENSKLKKDLEIKNWQIRKASTDFEQLLADQEAVIRKYKERNTKVTALFKCCKIKCETLKKELYEIKFMSQQSEIQKNITSVCSKECGPEEEKFNMADYVPNLLDSEICSSVHEFVHKYKLQKIEIDELKNKNKNLLIEQRLKDGKSVYVLEAAKKQVMNLKKLVREYSNELEALRTESTATETKNNEKDKVINLKVSYDEKPNETEAIKSEEKREIAQRMDVSTQRVSTLQQVLSSYQNQKVDFANHNSTLPDSNNEESRLNDMSNPSRIHEKAVSISSLMNIIPNYDRDMAVGGSSFKMMLSECEVTLDNGWKNNGNDGKANNRWNVKSFICNICSRSLNSKNALYKHLKQQHNKGHYKLKNNFISRHPYRKNLK